MKALLVVVSLLSFGACVWGNTPEQIAEWKEAAANGDPVAQFNLGEAYCTGSGVLENDKEAVKWWRKAAEQGHADGQTAIGWAYANGDGNGGKDRFLKSFISKNSVKSVNSRAWFYHC